MITKYYSLLIMHAVNVHIGNMYYQKNENYYLAVNSFT